MKFMLLLKDGTSAPQHDEHVQLNRKVSGWLGELLANKKVECAYYMIPGKGMCIVDVDSHEDLVNFMRSWPFYKYTTWEIHPLADARFAVENYYSRLLKPDGKE